MMRLHVRSIAAKLFYLMTSLVVLTVVGNSLQNAVLFNRHIALQEQESTVDLAKERAVAIDSLIVFWRRSLEMLAHSVGLRGSAAEKQAELEAFLNADHDQIATALVHQAEDGMLTTENAAVTRALTDARFEGADAEAVGTEIEKGLRPLLADSLASSMERRLRLLRIDNSANLPVVVLMLPFTVGTPDEAPRLYWALSAVWSSRITALLPQTALIRARLRDVTGSVLASTRPSDFTPGTSAGHWLDDSVSHGQNFGSRNFRDAQGEMWLGAFARSTATDTILQVEKNAVAQQLAAISIIKRSALWAWIFILLAVLASFIGAAGITSNLRALGKTTVEIANGNLQASVDVKGHDEVAALGVAVHHMAGRIQVLLSEQVVKAQLEKEMETARIVQTTLLPRNTSGSQRALQVGARYQSASQCGGDWWGRFPTRDGGEFICIGDATGHGVGAALVTVLAYAGCMADSVLSGAEHHETPAALLTRLNRLLWQSVGQTTAMSFFAAHFDLERGVLTYSNAGHPFPLLFPASPADNRLPRRELEGSPARMRPCVHLCQPSILLGQEPDSTFKDLQIPLKVGDKIVFYTDGLVECRNPQSRPWGSRNLKLALTKHLDKDPLELAEVVYKEATDFFAGTPIADDITFVVAEIKELGAGMEAPLHRSESRRPA